MLKPALLILAAWLILAAATVYMLPTMVAGLIASVCLFTPFLLGGWAVTIAVRGVKA